MLQKSVVMINEQVQRLQNSIKSSGWKGIKRSLEYLAAVTKVRLSLVRKVWKAMWVVLGTFEVFAKSQSANN